MDGDPRRPARRQTAGRSRRVTIDTAASARRREAWPAEVRFAADSSLEEARFEPPVPPDGIPFSPLQSGWGYQA